MELEIKFSKIIASLNWSPTKSIFCFTETSKALESSGLFNNSNTSEIKTLKSTKKDALKFEYNSVPDAAMNPNSIIIMSEINNSTHKKEKKIYHSDAKKRYFL